MTLMVTLRNKPRTTSRGQNSVPDQDCQTESINGIAEGTADDLVSSPQVFFMDSEDIQVGSNHVTNTQLPAYYQVATPKSPHELSLTEDDEHALHLNHSAVGHPHNHRESEETERMKYVVAKKEIMQQLNLQILIKHKEMDDLESESKRLEAQMKVLKTLHDDKELLEKVDQFQLRKAEKKGEELNMKRRFQELGSFQYPTTAPANTSGEFYYHTRSKSTHSISGNSSKLRPANENVIGMRVLGGKTLHDGEQNGNGTFSNFQNSNPFAPQYFNQHHRRNYSTNCISSNSGVVGKAGNGDAIFRRLDGLLIIITCCKCGKSGFTSAQGIVNHSRLKHSKSYSSQPLAVLNNQFILPEDQQNKIVVDKFRELDLDPSKNYLPNPLGISQIAASSTGSSTTIASSNKRDTSPTHILSSVSPTDLQPPAEFRSTKHLEKMYGKKDFQDIVDYVKEAKNDLDIILKIGSDMEEDSSNQQHHSEEQSEILSQHNSQDQEQTFKFKRKASTRMDKDMKESMKPAEKKARPDAVALVELPEEEKRSSHYNLRAKSKLKSFSRRE
ncbi:Ahc1p Ecym_5597 [Eremothecium cymbalariae DBVPG|uniref:Protein AHC1 n=1 Tax=Eremothecium cymbalariae (strain CBS 270.75 / DBVPG 7215 / KCTC 17166 / NRRL Y-17582) TaxID=931890 RepID=I6NE42_ERECY|nr:hypothetical protein Ecym_5597 [Eremothecium cymbalariae DBVPG\